MILRADLRAIARARLKASEVLLTSRRYDGAIYLCGYAVEISLKARLCQSLNWPGWPETAQDFKQYPSLKIHDLDSLVMLSGVGARIKASHLLDWPTVREWRPDLRYRRIGTATRQNAEDMIAAARRIMRAL